MNSIDKRIPLISHQVVDAAIAAGFVAAVVVVLLQMPSLSIFQIWVTCIHIVQQSSLVCLLNIFDILSEKRTSNSSLVVCSRSHRCCGSSSDSGDGCFTSPLFPIQR